MKRAPIWKKISDSDIAEVIKSEKQEEFRHKTNRLVNP